MSSFVYPDSALLYESDAVLTTKQINQWKTNGFILINNVIQLNIIKKAVKDASHILRNFHAKDFGTGGLLEFPTSSLSINQLTLHPRLLTAVSQLLNTSKFRLFQADLWKKEGVAPQDNYDDRQNTDQRMHMDYPNHTLVHPPTWSKHEAVEIIIYLSDCNDCGGNTALIPRESHHDPAYIWPYTNMPGVGRLPYINDRKSAESYIRKRNTKMSEFRNNLYDREKYAYFTPGTVLFYRYDLWHRGTPLKMGKVRYIQNMAFVKDSADWVGNWNCSAARSMYSRDQMVEMLIATISPFQRSVLFGFPRIGSSYWNKYTLEAVRERYQCFGFDISPYENAIENKQIVSKL